jgi:ribosomal protein S18 acetylase RimI-like enzyme
MLFIRSFTPADQPAVRTLILNGLASRFGFADPAYTPDLDDIGSYYIGRGETVLVAVDRERIVSCGMLQREDGSDTIGRIVRMSVADTTQGQGLGRQIGEALLAAAQERGFIQVRLETNDDWHSALRLYTALGFTEVERRPNPEFGFVEVHMALTL